MDHVSPEPLPEDVVSVILSALDRNPPGREAFTEGLSKHLHFLSLEPGPEAQARLLQFVSHWLLDVALVNTPSWVQRVEESEAAVDEHRLGAPISTDKLRSLLNR